LHCIREDERKHSILNHRYADREGSSK
jgi:hypothetical protein